jgi:hypothetical protein
MDSSMTKSQLDDDALERQLVASRELEDAPESLVLQAIALWDQRPRPLAPPTMRRVLLAALSFDSTQPVTALAGVRAHEEARHLLFSMEGRDVDIRIKRSGAGVAAGWIVSGQVLGPDQAGTTTIRCGDFQATVQWSDLCEFHVEPVPPGECEVSLHTEDWEAVLPAFDMLPTS